MSNKRAGLNGTSTRWKPRFNEPTETVSVRLPKSIATSIDKLLEPKQTRSEWFRQRIIEIVEKEAKERSSA